MMERSADWMGEARRDLEHAENDLAGGFHNWACFSAQQAAEKSVKAVFQRMGAEAWGYSVADLLGELSRHACIPKAHMDAALELDKSYISARYPNAHPSGSPSNRYTEQEARRHISHARAIIELCAGLLSEVPPG